MPRKDRQRFLVGCETVELAFSEILPEPGEPIRHVYFPTDSFISLTKPASLEVGLVGDEGMLGTSLVLVSMFRRCTPRSKVLALRTDTASFQRELGLSPDLQRVLKRYLHVVVSQLAQTEACTRFHVVEAHLARWLFRLLLRYYQGIRLLIDANGGIVVSLLRPARHTTVGHR